MYDWALETMQFVRTVNLEQCRQTATDVEPAASSRLQHFVDAHPSPLTAHTERSVEEMLNTINSADLQDMWSKAKRRCDSSCMADCYCRRHLVRRVCCSSVASQRTRLLPMRRAAGTSCAALYPKIVYIFRRRELKSSFTSRFTHYYYYYYYYYYFIALGSIDPEV